MHKYGLQPDDIIELRRERVGENTAGALDSKYERGGWQNGPFLQIFAPGAKEQLRSNRRGLVRFGPPLLFPNSTHHNRVTRDSAA